MVIEKIHNIYLGIHILLFVPKIELADELKLQCSLLILTLDLEHIQIEFQKLEKEQRLLEAQVGLHILVLVKE